MSASSLGLQMLKMFLICFLKPFLKGEKRSKFDFDHHFAFFTNFLKRQNFLLSDILFGSSRGSFSKKCVQNGPFRFCKIGLRNLLIKARFYLPSSRTRSSPLSTRRAAELTRLNTVLSPLHRTSHLTKILKRIMRDRIVSHLEVNVLLCNNQHVLGRAAVAYPSYFTTLTRFSIISLAAMILTQYI